MDYVPVLEQRARRTAAGIELRLRSPLSRSVPLSVVTLTVRVDGREIEPGDLTFCVNDADFSLAELPTLHDEWWFTLDAARVRVRLSRVAARHDVDVDLGIRTPFTSLSDGVVVRRVQSCRVETSPEPEAS
jgi:hypothetical protein